MILETAVASTSPLLDPFPRNDDQEMHYSNKEDDDHNNNNDDDELDGMIMLDDDDHNMLLSPPPLQSTVFNDTAPKDADTSQNYLPEHSSSPDSDDNNIHWRLSNAVHMELQENAKLPTFHWNIDRTGSSTTNKFDVSQFFHTTTATGVTGMSDQRKSRSNSIDCDDLSFTGGGGGVDASSVNLEEYLEIGENTGTTSMAPTKSQQQHLSSFNLTEIFLTSEMSQRHTNFPTHKSSRFDANAVPPSAATPNLYHNNDLDVDIDPTPLSEIKRKLSSRKSDSSLEKLPKNTTTPQVVTDTPYWPRREQLPIPSPIPPPVDMMTVENENKNTLPHDAVNTKVQIPESLQSTVPASVSFHTATNPKPTPGTYQTKLIGSWKTQEPQHSSIHSISRPAVQVASQKRTQYGFGRKHVVPSVPATTTTNKSTNKNTKCKSPTSQKKTTKNYSRSSSQRSQSTAATTNSTVATHTIVRAPSLTSHDDDDSGSGGGGGGGSNSNMTGNVAYERKKERAKTARIRLNESIDRLQIALNMAGTQSNQRLAMFQEQTIPYRIISDCIKCSEDAKKWDRPSFVGSAATMIQGLNAQCEALVRALHDERHARAEQTVSTPTNVDVAIVATTSTVSKNDEDSKGQSDSISMSTGVKHAYSENNFNNSTSIGVTFKEETSTKRLKVDDSGGNCDRKPIGEETEARNAVILDDSIYAKVRFAEFAEKSILDRIASFLEPISLLRCKRVCRDWKSSGAFANEALWQRLAVDRFGFYNVRQWLAKVEDFAQKEVHSPTSLYKMMDATNIMPHCRLDGMLLLGESRLLGKVSAWTYLVERSNGETMRSVARHSSMPGTGVYTSLPIVQLRTIIQNTGIHDDVVVIREQIITVDASTRRRGDEMVEIDWDDRFKKQILNLDGTAYVPKVPCGRTTQSIYRELCRLRLYEAVVLETNIHARGCATTSKFVQKSNFTKLLIQIRDGTTVPLVIPFPRDASHLLP